MKKHLIISKLVLIMTLCVKGQDIHFSQFFEAPQSVNPSLTGFFEGSHRFILNYKDQWRALGSPYQTYAFSYDMGFNKAISETGYLALGSMIYNDVAGDLRMSTLQAILNVAYHLYIDENQTIGGAISGGVGQKSLDISIAEWEDQYNVNKGGHDPNIQTGETMPFNNFLYPDLGFGFHYSIRNEGSGRMSSNDGLRANIGISVHHVNSPKMRFYTNSDASRLYPRISGHGQSSIGISGTNLAICPGFFYYKQGPMQEIYFGSNFRYMLRESSKYTGFIGDAYFTLGGYHRFGDAAVLFSQLEINNLAIGISYDINVSRLRLATAGRGGIEFSLRYIISPKTAKSFYH